MVMLSASILLAFMLYAPGLPTLRSRLTHRFTSKMLVSTSAGLGSTCDRVLGGLHQYDVLLRAVDGHTPMHDMHHPQFAALHMSMSAISLQWLSSTRPGGLLGLQDSCFAVCRMATLACTYGLMQQQRGIQAQGQQQAVGGCTHSYPSCREAECCCAWEATERV